MSENIESEVSPLVNKNLQKTEHNTINEFQFISIGQKNITL